MAYEAVDLRFSADGDLMVDQGGAIVDTALYPLLSLKQEVVSRILTNVGDLPQHPWLGTNAQQYVGEPNSDKTAEDLIESITVGLTNDGLVDAKDLSFEWARWDEHTLVMVITIDVGPLDPDGEGKLEIPFAFDFNDLGVTIYE